MSEDRVKNINCGNCLYFQLRTIHSVPVKNCQGFCKKHSDYLYDWNYCEDHLPSEVNKT